MNRLKLLWKVWRELRASDERLGQLVWNVAEIYSPSPPFFIDDDLLAAALDQRQRDRLESATFRARAEE
jgi:hypothetical protein